MKEAQICISAINAGRKLLVCGNGGSATQAQHFAAELVVRYRKNRIALPALALTSDIGVLTACANDFGYEKVFVRQLEALAKEGDVLIGISTSGRSQNVLYAQDYAHVHKLSVIEVPRVGANTAEIQENQMHFLHQLAEEIEDAFVD